MRGKILLMILPLLAIAGWTKLSLLFRGDAGAAATASAHKAFTPTIDRLDPAINLFFQSAPK